MASFLGRLRVQLGILLLLGLMATLTACENTSSAHQGTPSSSSFTLTVSGMSDTQAQLVTKMYAFLLKHAGFEVVERAAFASNDAIFNALNSGQLDLYPEFTATGLVKLGLNSTGNAQQDYLQIKQGYEARYHITWLDISPLNNTYSLCTTSARASSLKITKISDLAKKASLLTIAVPLAGVKEGINILKRAYGLTFKKVVSYSQENLTFPAVTSGTQDLNLCDATNPALASGHFVLLRDDRQAFPVYNPAPIVRDGVLKKAPQLALILNKLAPFLTTQESQQLQAEVVDGQSLNEVARIFLHNKGLL